MPMEAILFKFGNIALSISFETSCFSCDAVVSCGYLTNNWRNVFHSVRISVDIMAAFTVSSPSTVSASLSSP